ncbi:DUF4249 domain-containing protein [Mucilaginibacter limnophilus]|uniref:DUF4249 domain-containing protein n=1 Tax=Mucilaginibacter limnophilus TaxID=1932778 RepID=A0A437MK68_9SPHI|nr:DUF4249 domain-containing protein [Mucilaginibacter limnophilus]RVT98050.1 DUF4249 domain-containing protein [Mucilaginibacter limnophilus]
MLKRITYLSLAAAGSFFFSSCEKVIDVDIKESPSQLVIEGNIRDGDTDGMIKVTRSVSYTDPNSYPAVTDAEIIVTDKAGFTWHPQQRDVPGEYYFRIEGHPGETYTMNVKVDGKEYIAKSTMPQPVQLDSIGITLLTFGNEERKVVAAYFKDPKGVQNQYRYQLYVNGKLTKRVYANDDRLTDGNDIKEQLFYQDDEDNEEINEGDVVQVQMQCIDRPVFKYWLTLADQSQNGPGGGVTPGNPPSNISGGALGYFSAHTLRMESLTVK